MNMQGNHGEDVKELYYYLDGTPTHSYMRAMYKYPQAEFPYKKLVEENLRRSRGKTEYELLDTGMCSNSYLSNHHNYAILCLNIGTPFTAAAAAPVTVTAAVLRCHSCK